MSSAQTIFSAQSPGFAVSATATASTAVQLPQMCSSVRIVNEGPNIAFVAIGPTSSTTATLPAAGATNTCTPIPVGDVTLSISNQGQQWISAICRAAGTAVMTVQMGEGL